MKEATITQTTTDTTYNGYTNYPTWNVALWLDNDEGIYNHMAHTIPTITDEDRTRWTRQRVNIIADYIEEFVSESFDMPTAGMAADLIGWTLQQVNWQEIAENYANEYPAR